MSPFSILLHRTSICIVADDPSFQEKAEQLNLAHVSNVLRLCQLRDLQPRSIMACMAQLMCCFCMLSMYHM